MTFGEISKMVNDSDILIVNHKNGELQSTIKRGMEINARNDFIGYYAAKEVAYITACNYRTLEVGVKL